MKDDNVKKVMHNKLHYLCIVPLLLHFDILRWKISPLICPALHRHTFFHSCVCSVYTKERTGIMHGNFCHWHENSHGILQHVVFSKNECSFIPESEWIISHQMPYIQCLVIYISSIHSHILLWCTSKPKCNWFQQEVFL